MKTFSAGYCPGGATACATRNFDCDCDGTQAPRWGALAGTCTPSRGTCAGSGWLRGVPACGVVGQYQECVLNTVGGCSPAASSRAQECR